MTSIFILIWLVGSVVLIGVVIALNYRLDKSYRNEIIRRRIIRRLEDI